MVEIIKDLDLKIDSLEIDFIKTLRENDSLIHFIRNFIINKICEKINLEINFEDLNKSFCANNKIKDKDQLLKYLRVKGMHPKDHKRNLINSQKVLRIAKDEFSEKAKSNFIKNKELLDLYTYDFIEFNESDYAHEIFFQFESKESSFHDFCIENGNDSLKIKSCGKKGPLNLLRISPIIKEKLLKISINDVIPPFKVGNVWLLIILREKNEAKFDELTESKMVLSLFDEWINLLTVNSIQKFFID
tara:strand:+ start:250 stop:987 length:738 start_codon:yes stop_codon:yes gene_type:complete